MLTRRRRRGVLQQQGVSEDTIGEFHAQERAHGGFTFGIVLIDGREQTVCARVLLGEEGSQ